jgi:hypothetical protein
MYWSTEAPRWTNLRVSWDLSSSLNPGKVWISFYNPDTDHAMRMLFDRQELETLHATCTEGLRAIDQFHDARDEEHHS